MMPELQAAPLSDALDIEVTGLHLREAPDRSWAAQLNALVATHLVALLRDNRACVPRAHPDCNRDEDRVLYRLLMEGDVPFH